MIGDDRIALNKRFIELFHLLEERGDIVKNDRMGKGIGDFAEKVLGNRTYGHLVRAFLNPDDKRVIDYKHARALCRVYSVNEAYLLEGMGTPFGLELPKHIEIPAKTANGNILFTTTEAFAGVSVDVNNTKERYEFFSLPGMRSTPLVAFPVNGDSMEPIIQDGDIVVCRQVNLISDIRDNKIYAVKNNGSVWIKYVQKINDDKGKVKRLKLISANYLEYDPFFEDINEHTRLYQVMKRIADL
jgi:hypothetical protein